MIHCQLQSLVGSLVGSIGRAMVLIIDDGVITKAFYPVFPPDQSAAVVVSWLRASR